MSPETHLSWLESSLPKKKFERSHIDYSKTTDYSSVMGQVAETVAAMIIKDETMKNGNFKKDADLLDPFNQIVGYIKPKVQKLPYDYKTFTNSRLVPVYFNALEDESVDHAIKTLAVNIDEKFGTQFFKEFALLIHECEVDGSTVFPDKMRYLIDTLLMIARLRNDKDALEILHASGQLISNVHLGVTQFDGIYLDPLFNIPEFTSNKDRGDFLANQVARKPLVPKYSEGIPPVVDCGILSIKAHYRARWVAERPPLINPKKYHITETVTAIRKTVDYNDFVFAPSFIQLLYLGSLQPIAVHTINCDEFFWQSCANIALEERINLRNSKNFPLINSARKFYKYSTTMMLERQLMLNMKNEVKSSSNHCTAKQRHLNLMGLKRESLSEGGIHQRTDFQLRSRENIDNSKPKRFQSEIATPIPLNGFENI